MAKWKYPKPMNKTVASVSKTVLSIKRGYEAARHPLSFAMEKSLSYTSQWDKKRRVGNIRNRSQYFDKKSKKWIKINPKTNETISVKQTPGKYKKVAVRKNRQEDRRDNDSIFRRK